MATIKLNGGEDVLVIELPGLTAIRIDAKARVVAVDGMSGNPGDEPLSPEWQVLDLRDGIYGGFHRLVPADMCFDADCAGSGQHDVAGERGRLVRFCPECGHGASLHTSTLNATCTVHNCSCREVFPGGE
jgi:hypothetical protein